MILLLKIVDFEKKICTIWNEIGDFIGFQNLQKLIKNKNGGLHCLNACQNYYHNFLILYPILIRLVAVFYG